MQYSHPLKTFSISEGVCLWIWYIWDEVHISWASTNNEVAGWNIYARNEEGISV